MSILNDLKTTFELKFNKKIIGVLYSNTNEIENKIEIFGQFENGEIKSLKKISTKGEGTGTYSSFHDGESSDPQLSSYSVIVSKDNNYLFNINGGDNSVTSFKIKKDGDLEFIDNAKTNATGEKSVNSLAYNDEKNKLYVGHSYGTHIHTFEVNNGKLKKIEGIQSVNVGEFTNRYMPSIIMSPDNKFLIAHVLVNDDPKAVGPKPADTDNIVVFKIDEHGKLGAKKFFTISVGNFTSYFINKNQFVVASALSNEISLVKLDEKGEVQNLNSVKVEAMDGKAPAESCWLAYDSSKDNMYVTNFGYGTISLVNIKKDQLTMVDSNIAYVKGDGTEKGLAGIETSAPVDIFELNGYIYELYPNISKIIGYKIEENGSLTKIDEKEINYRGQYGLIGINHM